MQISWVGDQLDMRQCSVQTSCNAALIPHHCESTFQNFPRRTFDALEETRYKELLDCCWHTLTTIKTDAATLKGIPCVWLPNIGKGNLASQYFIGNRRIASTQWLKLKNGQPLHQMSNWKCYHQSTLGSQLQNFKIWANFLKWVGLFKCIFNWFLCWEMKISW